MARNGSALQPRSPAGLFSGHALSAPSPTLFGHERVGIRELVPGVAMAFGAIAGAVGDPTKREARQIFAPSRRNNLGKREPGRNTRNDGVSLYPRSVRKISRNKFLTVNCDAPSDGLIPGLLPLRRPTAILRLIVSVVVPALNRKTWSVRRQHVLFERGVAVCPPIANADAPTAVTEPSCAVGVRASLLHALPDVPKRRSATLPRHRSRLLLRPGFQLTERATHWQWRTKL